MYEYWRFRILVSSMIGYAGFYLIRQNLTMAIPFMESELHYSKMEIGVIISVAAMIYGLGKGIFGVLSDKSNARYFMAAGLFLSALMNICIGFSSSITMFMLLWALNSCFQSMGWPPCARLLTHWFSPKELATKWAIWNMSQQIGGASIIFLSSYLVEHYRWTYLFYVPGVLAMCVSFFLIFALRDTPESVGLPPIEKYHGLVEADDHPESMMHIFIHRVLTNKLVWYVSLANFFVYIVRMSVFNWAPTFLMEAKHLPLKLAGQQTALFDIMGMFGGVVAGALSDRYFKGYRGRTGVLFTFLLGITIIMLWKIENSHFIAMMLIGFLVSGPQILVGVAASDFASKKAAGAASGFTGTWGYLGTSVTGVGIGYIVEHFGWNAAFVFMAASSFMACFFFALIWNHRSNLLS